VLEEGLLTAAELDRLLELEARLGRMERLLSGIQSALEARRRRRSDPGDIKRASTVTASQDRALVQDAPDKTGATDEYGLGSHPVAGGSPGVAVPQAYQIDGASAPPRLSVGFVPLAHTPHKCKQVDPNGVLLVSKLNLNLCSLPAISCRGLDVRLLARDAREQTVGNRPN
jgi:hypothetical protein